METCVCCGEPIPEGTQVCYKCEHQYDEKEVIYMACKKGKKK